MAHSLALGTEVIVTRLGVVQPWGKVVVARHDRNGTYRLRFENDTYVTAHADEVAPVSRLQSSAARVIAEYQARIA